LERFRWWGVPNYGPDCPPLTMETRKRNGRKLAKSFPKKFVGDLGQIVDITDQFKQERFRDIQALHEVISNEREEWMETDPPIAISNTPTTEGYLTEIPILVVRSLNRQTLGIEIGWGLTN